MAKVTLDRETFKALASETRLDVLHALDERRKTGSELARELNLNKATVHEHLNILLATGLVAKEDEGRKWIYWKLTWNGTKLLHPDQGATFSVLLGISALAAGGGIVSIGRALGWWLIDKVPSNAGPSDFGLAYDREADTANDQEQASPAADEGASSGGGSNATASEAPQQSALEDSAPFNSADGDSGFFDDGGWIALALIATAILAMVLAGILRRR